MGWRRGKPYGQDLRDRVLAQGDAPLRAVAARFGVSPSYVSKVRARRRELGESTPGPQRNRVAPRLAPVMEALRMRVAAERAGRDRRRAAGLDAGRARRAGEPPGDVDGAGRWRQCLHPA